MSLIQTQGSSYQQEPLFPHIQNQDGLKFKKNHLHTMDLHPQINFSCNFPSDKYAWAASQKCTHAHT